MSSWYDSYILQSLKTSTYLRIQAVVQVLRRFTQLLNHHKEILKLENIPSQCSDRLSILPALTPKFQSAIANSHSSLIPSSCPAFLPGFLALLSFRNINSQNVRMPELRGTLKIIHVLTPMSHEGLALVGSHWIFSWESLFGEKLSTESNPHFSNMTNRYSESSTVLKGSALRSQSHISSKASSKASHTCVVLCLWLVLPECRFYVISIILLCT